MAQRYSDIVKLRESKPAYNIQNEEKGEWDQFIANDQFNNILRKVVSAVYNNDADTHKSFWVEGTYGTGKSHAGAVIMHLLCDTVDDIQEWLETEYKAAKYTALKSSIYHLREQKRLFPVKMYGQSSISHKSDLSLQLQKAIKQALKDGGIDITVKTDFDNYVEHIETNVEIWDIILDKSPQLRSVAPDRKKLMADLRNQDTDTLSRAENALRESGIDVRLDAANLESWFFEVQDKLREISQYDGLLILWDEFTDVMTSDIGPSLLVELQKLTEAAMNSKNDSYFFFISHPSALNSLKAEERDKTKGRYHYMKYNMEPVSAFKIMSRKFKVVGNDMEYHNLTDNFFMQNADLLDLYSQGSANPEETKGDIKNLFPVHPATANLATYYAREAGSSSRSVFEFLGDNIAIREFLDDSIQYLNRNTITADYLWDYVVDEFNSNVSKFGAVTERYNSFRLHVKNKGPYETIVFKSILLLNALNNIANNDSVTPSEENIKNLFLGTNIEYQVDEILAWINEEGVIQRTPAGIYSIQFSALPTKEIADIREKLQLTEFRYTSQIINFGETAKVIFGNNFKQVMRAFEFQFYGVDANGYTLLNKIENGRKAAKNYELFLAILVARNYEELNQLKSTVEEAAKDERFASTIFLLFEAPFGDNNYDRFIEYMANAKCAQQHGFADQQKANTDNAEDMIAEWIKEMRRAVVNIYVGELHSGVAASKLTTTIKTVLSPIIFSSGAESLEIIRLKSAITYWKKAVVRDTVKTVLSFNTKQDINDHSKGPAMHITYLLQDSVDENLEWKPDVDPLHPLKQVCDFVDKKIKYADKQLTFNLAEKFIELSRPPFGLYQTYSGMGMLAFAMRKYADKIFDLNGKPRTAMHLIDDVLEVFKSWENGNISQKVTLKFETPEENQLCKRFISLFKLKEFKEYSDISSLKDARWAISHEFVTSKGYPLWSLKYAEMLLHPMVAKDGISNEDLNTIIDNIVKICNEVGTSNPSMMAQTIELLKKWDFEFKPLLNGTEYFRNGFMNFLKKEPNVKLQDHEVNAAIDYIKKHIQSEIGTWKEEEVINALKNWRISTIPSSTPVSPLSGVIPVSLTSVSPAPVPTDAHKEKMEKVKNHVNMMSPDQLKHALNKVVELGYDNVLDMLLNL